MAQSSRTFRIFVSSTFSDLKAERNALQEKVFPRLKDMAMAHGCRFQAIDLRWGISDEATLDQQTMKICLGEIARCQKTSPRPNFIILLGDRYGWRPLPYEIQAEEFEQIISLVPMDDKALLKTWYRRDDNAVPPVYCLLPRNEEFLEFSAWQQVENKLRRVFLEAIEKSSLPPDARLIYTGSATEQEIVAGALRIPDSQEHVFGYFRKIEGLPDNESSRDYRDGDPDSTSRLSELKARLIQQLPDNSHDYQAAWIEKGPSLDHIDRLCEDVYADLSRVMLSEISHLEAVDPLEKEIYTHDDFVRERTRVFIGRVDLLEAIANYVQGRDHYPLVIWGGSGSGKSALMAKTVEQVQSKGQLLIYRFIGATPESSNGRSLLESLCRQITRYYGEKESTIPSKYEDLVQEFPKRLALARPEKPLFLILDALDQLSDTDDARNLIWLPATLPPNVHLIVSTLPGECLLSLESKVPLEGLLEIKSMSQEDGKLILTQWLVQAKRKLQPFQEQRLLDNFQKCAMPLYLKLVFEEARLWKSYDPLPELSVDIPGILRHLFERLSHETNHGKIIVSRSLGYLAAAKNGLSEDELLEVLSMDTEVLADFRHRSPNSPTVERLPAVIWSRLYFDLEPYLMERKADGISLLGFYHRQVWEICQKEYRNEEYHHFLAGYFAPLSLYLDTTKQMPNLRKLSELVFQQVWAGLCTQVEKTLLDYSYLEAKIAGQSLQDLIEDYDLPAHTGLQLEKKKTLALLQEALRLSTFFLEKDPQQLPAQLTGRLVGLNDPDIQKLLEQACSEVTYPWLRPIRQCFSAPGGSERFTLSGHSFFIGPIVFSPDGKKVVTGGKDGIVKVHDLQTGTVKHLLNANNWVHCVSISPDGRLILAGLMGGIIKAWDMETGMQKLDLYAGNGLPIQIIEVTPESRQAVSFSYDVEPAFDQSLKVWDLETGRLMFSLDDFMGPIQCMAVSVDGRTVVHGAVDGTIKVWDLQSGNLKFILEGHTAPIKNLAIAPDGHVLVSSAHAPKLIGRGPGEFIEQDTGPWQEDHTLRVWNLETGEEKYTLVGHEAEINTIRIAPNCEFVLSGSEDGIVKVWDLKSGTVKFSFSGHTTTICCLAIAPDGSLAVSSAATPARIADGPDKDHSPRVWDLQRGKLKFILSGHSGWINSLDLLSDGRTLLSSSMDQTLRMWNLDTGKETLCIPGFRPVISPSGRLIISGSSDNSLKVWNLDGGRNFQSLAEHAYGVKSLMISSSANVIITAAKDKEYFYAKRDFRPLDGFTGGSIKLWSTETGEELQTFPEHIQYFNGMAISPNGKVLASVSADCKLDIIDLTEGTLKFSLNGKYPLAISPDGNTLVSCAADFSLQAIDLASGKIKWIHEVHVGEIRTISITPDGKMVLTGSRDKTLKLWDLGVGEVKMCLAGHSDEVLASAISPSGKVAISASKDGNAIIWDLQTGKQEFSFPGAYPFTFSPDGKLVVFRTADANGNVLNVWDLIAGRKIGELAGHLGPVNGLAISIDGRWVISAAGSSFLKIKDDTLKVWDLETMANIATFYADESFECNPGLTTEPWKIIIGDETGRMYFLQMENVVLGPAIVTPGVCGNAMPKN